MLWLAVLLVSLQFTAVRVPPVLGGDDEGHSRREGPTREGEVSRGERRDYLLPIAITVSC